MTYKLNPELRKLRSPVVLVFPDGETRAFENGTAVTEAVFDRSYQLEALRARDGVIEVKLAERAAPDMSWCGDEPVSFF